MRQILGKTKVLIIQLLFSAIVTITGDFTCLIVLLIIFLLRRDEHIFYYYPNIILYLYLSMKFGYNIAEIKGGKYES